jgi:hypothetical protein
MTDPTLSAFHVDLHQHEQETNMRMQRPDKVDHPSHYGGKGNPYEAIKVIEAWQAGFNVGNALKYICRAGKKEEKEGVTGLDYKKACWYLLRELALREGCMDPNHYTDLLKAAEPGQDTGDQCERLADWIMANVPGEPSRSEGAADTAIKTDRGSQSESS